MTFIATATKNKDGQPGFDFGSEYNRSRVQDWLKRNIGKQLKITPVKKPVSSELRGYYFGAVLSEVRQTCDAWKDLSSTELHEIVKKMLFYFETYNPITKRVERFGRSVMANDDWNNTQKAMQFLEILRQYLADCGRDMPDSEEYKRFRDSAPMKKNG